MRLLRVVRSAAELQSCISGIAFSGPPSSSSAAGLKPAVRTAGRFSEAGEEATLMEGGDENGIATRDTDANSNCSQPGIVLVAV